MKLVFYHPGGAIYNGGDVEPRGWYFWSETLDNYYGPYPTEEEGCRMLAEYIKWL